LDIAHLLLQTCYAVFEITVQLPTHLKREKFVVKLFGQACLPEVEIIQPQEEEEEIVLNFGHTFVKDSNGRKLTFKNIGVITAQVIVEIYEDPNLVFTFDTYGNAKNPLTDYQIEGQFFSILPSTSIASKII